MNCGSGWYVLTSGYQIKLLPADTTDEMFRRVVNSYDPAPKGTLREVDEPE